MSAVAKNLGVVRAKIADAVARSAHKQQVRVLAVVRCLRESLDGRCVFFCPQGRYQLTTRVAPVRPCGGEQD